MRHSLKLAACCGVFALAAGVVVARQDKNGWTPPKPGPEHELLKSFVGTWDCAVKSYTEPGKPPTESKGTETITPFAGGFWFMADFKCEMGGMPYQGHGMRGYDQVKKKYIGTWLDSMSSGLMVMEGTYDDATRTFTSTADAPGMDGKPARWKGVHVIKDAKKHIFTLSVAHPEGKEIPCMEITYTKK